MFSTPLGLLGLLIVPIVWYIHHFRRKAQQRIVPSLLLWTELHENSPIGGQKTAFRSSLLFWLEVATVVALAVALAGPGCTKTTRHHIEIIDLSLSMSHPDLLPSIGQKITQSWEQSDQITLISSQGELITSARTSVEQARNTLDSLRAIYPSADWNRAISLAQTLTPHSSIRVHSDALATDRIPENVSWHAYGTAQSNIAITRAEWSNNQLRVSIWNASDQRFEGTLLLSQGEQTLNSTELSINPDETTTTRFRDSSEQPIQVRIVPSAGYEKLDSLPTDSVLWLVHERPAKLFLASDFEELNSAQLGLSAGSDLSRVRKIIPNTSMATPMNAHLLFTDRAMGGGQLTWRIGFSQRTQAQRKGIASSGIWLNQDSPFLRDVSSNDWVWQYNSDRRLRGLALISHNNISIMTQQLEGKRQIFRVNALPGSTVFSTPSWPILLYNICEARRALLPGIHQKNIVGGETIRHINAPAGEWLLEGESTSQMIQHAGGTLELSLPSFGLFRLRNAANSQAMSLLPLSQTESNLQELNSGIIDAKISSNSQLKITQSDLRWLLTCAIILLVVHWLIGTRSKALLLREHQ